MKEENSVEMSTTLDKRNSIILVSSNVQESLDTHLSCLKLLLIKYSCVLVLTSGRPYSNLDELYRGFGLDTSKVKVIDCISKGIEPSIKGKPGVLFLDRANDLSEIAVAIHQFIKNSNDSVALLIDSLSSLSIYNKPEPLARFLHTTMTRLRIREMSGIILSTKEQGNQEVLIEIAQLCDKIVE